MTRIKHFARKKTAAAAVFPYPYHRTMREVMLSEPVKPGTVRLVVLA